MDETKILYGAEKALDLKFFIALSRSINLLNKRANCIFRKYNLTNKQFAVLEALYHKGDLSIGQIIEKVLSTGGNMTVVINNLEKEGMVKKDCARDDNRVCIISLTAKGKGLIEKIFPEYLEDLQNSLSCFSEIEKNEIVSALKKLN